MMPAWWRSSDKKWKPFSWLRTRRYLIRFLKRPWKLLKTFNEFTVFLPPVSVTPLILTSSLANIPPQPLIHMNVPLVRGCPFWLLAFRAFSRLPCLHHWSAFTGSLQVTLISSEFVMMRPKSSTLLIAAPKYTHQWKIKGQTK